MQVVLAWLLTVTRRAVARLRCLVEAPRRHERPAAWQAVSLCVDLDSARLDAVSRSLLWGLGVDALALVPAVHRAPLGAAGLPPWRRRPPGWTLRRDA